MNKKVLAAMSGGVDSSVAVYLLKKQGYDCTGAMMKLYVGGDVEDDHRATCCSLEDAEDARTVAFNLGIPFYVFNFTECFGEEVIQRFVNAYKNGVTPNPCIDCNRFVKFSRFLRRAHELEMEYIATGHYACIEYDAASSRFLLKKGVDISKDQSYVLYSMTQHQLAKTLFPLGELSKSQVREIACRQNFINAKKRDSQDICFVPDGNYARFIESHTGAVFEKGRFIDVWGNDVGEHKGIIHYTVGQRRGLGLASPVPLYVCSVQPENNAIVIGEANHLYSKTLTAKDINLIAAEKLDTPLKCRAKIRYKHPEQPATVYQLDSDTLRIDFDSPQRAVTKGQAVVLYDGDIVIGGGTIM